MLSEKVRRVEIANLFDSVYEEVVKVFALGVKLDQLIDGIVGEVES